MKVQGLKLVVYDLDNILEILFSVVIFKNSSVITVFPNIFKLFLDLKESLVSYIYQFPEYILIFPYIRKLKYN